MDSNPGKDYWYPSLSDTEIIEALSGWNISATPNLLKKPTEEFVAAIYWRCLEQVCGLTPDLIQEPVQSAVFSIRPEHQELHAAGIGMNAFCYHMTRFADAAKINDFSTKDIVLPEAKRTRRILSAFINFVNFAEQHVEELRGVRGAQEKTKEDRLRAAEDLARIRAQKADIGAQRKKDEPRAEALKKENDAVTAELFAMQELQTRLYSEIDELKAEKAATLQQKESLTNDAAVVADAVQRTRSRVVKSPERLRRNIETMGASQNEDRRTLASHDARIRELQAKANALLSIEKDVRDCIEQAQIVEKEMHLLDTAMRERADTLGHLEDRRIMRSELELRLERAQNQFANAKERLERAQRDLDEHRAHGQQTIERLQRQYESMASERKDNDKQVEELRRQANEVERRMAEHMKESAEEMQELLHEYWNLRTKNEVYMETLASKLGIKLGRS